MARNLYAAQDEEARRTWFKKYRVRNGRQKVESARRIAESRMMMRRSQHLIESAQQGLATRSAKKVLAQSQGFESK